ncbi:hypothetical protein NSA31_22940 [Bacillus subtilis]|uniref:hypothetical protein n=1 Tax=Bacillus subtilis TaxID=1423 RepID=UPI002149A623|nr:hypothetical protein [Bacillus subtilis]MCR1994598.1 hypothetical protein [Bacillus subtilis]
MKETPFYKSNWFTILMLIVFFPVGLILMWSNKKWTVTTRIVVSIVLVVLAIVGYSSRDNQTRNIAISNESTTKGKEEKAEQKDESQENRNKQEGKVEKTKKDQDSKSKEEAPKKKEAKKDSSNSRQESRENVEKAEKEKNNRASETKKDADKLRKESLVKDIQKLVGKKTGDKPKVAKVDLISTADDNNRPEKAVNITLNGSDSLTSKMIKQGMLMEAERIFPKVFENKEVKRVLLTWNFPLVDVKGNTKSEKVLSIQLERKTNEEINWENFDRDNFAIVADHYYEHPALNKE